MGKTSLSFRPTYASIQKINQQPISNGTFYISTDTSQTFFDINNKRLQIRDIVILSDEDQKDLLQEPIKKFYLTLQEGNLYYYNSGWIHINQKYDDLLDDALSNKLSELSGTLNSKTIDQQVSITGRITVQGNTFNGINQLVKTNASGFISQSLIQDLDDSLDSKVDKVEGKSLISDTEIQRLLTLNNYDDSQIRSAISGKVDKVSGKSLISDSEIQRLASVDNYDDAELRTAISGKQNIINAQNKLSAAFIEGLPTDHASISYVDQKVADLVNSAPETLDTLKELSDALSGDANFAATVMTQIGKKVDKVQGKSLIDDTEIARLAEVNNYDDSELRTAISGKQNVIDADHKLSAAYVEGLNDALTGKVDKIEGKGLSTNDYTDAQKQKLETVDEYIAITENTLAQNGKRYICQAASGLTITLPAGQDNKFIEIACQQLDQTKTITINPATGQNIDGEEQALILETSYSSVKLVFDSQNSNWNIVTPFIPNLNDQPLFKVLSGTFVQKETGKSLISDIQIARLAEVDNYDDSELRTAISGKQNIIDAEHKLSAAFIEGLPADTASISYVDQKVADLVNSAPETLDTLKELSDALSGDANFATTVMTQIGKKVDKVQGKSLISDAQIQRLLTLDNYDDTQIRTIISGKQNIIDAEHKLSAAYVEGLEDALTGKVEKVSGKGLSTNDYTDTQKQKLSALDQFISISSDAILQNGKRYICQATSGLVITLPVGQDNKFIEIASQDLDEGKSIIINAGQNQTICDDTSLKLEASYSSVTLVFDQADSNWKVVTPFIPSVGYDDTQLRDAISGKQSMINADNKLSAAFVEGLNDALTGKVDKVQGKSLISDSEIARLLTLNNYDDSEIRNIISGKQDIINEQHKLSAIYVEGLNDVLTGKVDKVEGKGLSTNDYTDAQKLKLAGLDQYVAISSDTTAENGKRYICQATSGLTITLPTGINNKFVEIACQELDQNKVITIYPNTDQTIDGEDEIQIDASYSSVKFVFDQENSNWNIVTPFIPNLNEEPLFKTLSGTFVQKVEGKSLISDEQITRLLSLDNYDDSELRTAISGKQDTIDADHKLSAAYVEGLNDALTGKVDKVQGKSLISDEQIARLAEIQNYDDVLDDSLDQKLSELSGTLLNSKTIDQQVSITGRITVQGNTFNGINQLVKTNALGKISQDLIDDLSGSFNLKQDVINSQNKLNAAYVEGLDDSLDSKVDKVSGKSLISDTQIARLLTLSNYNDEELRTAISGKQNIINAQNKLSAAFIEGLPADTASISYVDEKIADLVNSAPSTLDTLKELSDALSGDANFANTVMTQIGKKVDKVQGKSLISDTEIARLLTLNNYDDSQLRTVISGKVDKVEGKGLSTNDYTDAQKQKLETLDEYISLNTNSTVQNGKRYICQNTNGLTITLPAGQDNKFIEIACQQLLSGKQLVVNPATGENISNDTSLTLDTSYSSVKLVFDQATSGWNVVSPIVPNMLFAQTEFEELSGTFVQKVEGKSLISDAQIARLSSVVNYDDDELRTAISGKQDTIDAEHKLSAAYVEGLSDVLTGKQNTITSQNKLNALLLSGLLNYSDIQLDIFDTTISSNIQRLGDYPNEDLQEIQDLINNNIENFTE